MKDDIYSVKTFYVNNGKNIKGTLALFPEKYVFNGSVSTINWERAFVETGKVKVRTHLFKTEKPYVMIHEGDERCSPAFVLEPSQADQIASIIAELREKTCRECVAENERRRLEEEQRQRAEEERKKREEEKRRCLEKKEREYREEMERRYREEEERRLREEEARRLREEEERRCREEAERKRREEEERKAREALARKLEERKNRIEQEVAAVQNLAKDMDVPEPCDLAVKKAQAYFIDNPYRILGVSVIATNDSINASLDKIKKLIRLNAIKSFKSDFELFGLDRPCRDLSMAQHAYSILSDERYKWFWFADRNACIAWKSEDFRKELFIDGYNYGTYDLFLANYAYAVFFDPQFQQAHLWKPVLEYYVYMCRNENSSLIKSRFNEKELENIHISEVNKHFTAEILNPIKDLCDTQNVYPVLRLYDILKGNANQHLESLIIFVTKKITQWFTSKEEVVCSLINKHNEHQQTDVVDIKNAGDAYIKEVSYVIDRVLEVMKGEQVRYEMIKESFRSTIWKLMTFFHNSGDTEQAVDYANKCYEYCDDENKKKIRSVFGINAVKGAERDVPHADWDLMGDNYYEGKNGYDVDYHKAFQWYEKAAKSGNKFAQNSLGICCREGKGTLKSESQAAAWFEKAYENGNPDGAYNLAACYALGKGRTQNYNKAIELFAAACKLGHPDAAEVGKNLLEAMTIRQKMHRITQHKHYDLGMQIPIREAIIIEVTMSHSCNVYLLDGDNYEKYLKCDNFTYYGDRGVQSPYRVKIPNVGYWHLVIDNGDGDMTGIITSAHVRKLPI